MTVNSISNRVEYAGDGSSTAFSVGFYFLAQEDLKVYLRTAGGNENLQTLITDYTATGSGNPEGGSITMVTPPDSGEKLVIIRDPALTQLTDYQANDAFPAETHERALNKLTMQAQRLSERIDRSVTLEETATSGDGAYDFGGNRISNVAPPIDNEDAANKEHVDNTLQLVNAASGDESFSWVSASGVTGTPDVIVLTLSSIPSSPTAGFKVRFEPEGSNTGPVTVQLTDGTNTWPAIDLVDRFLGALSGGALFDNVPTEITYSGAAAKLVLNHDVGGPVTTVRDTFVGDGVLTDFTMSVTPAADNDVQVFIDGVHQHPDDWSFSGTTLTFTEAPPDTAKIVARIGNQAGAAAVPADGSVNEPKLANNAVTEDKIADGSVTQSKLGFPQVFSEMYVSPQQIIDNSNVITLAHGLSKRPWFFVVTLVCIADDHGYLAGDEVLHHSGSERFGSADSGCVIYTPNATQLRIVTASFVDTFITLTATASSNSGITAADWRLVVRALA